LFDVTGPGLAWARSVSSAGRMSALARRAAVASNTVPTSAIRFRFRFSPFDSRVASFGRVLAAAAAVAARSASWRITTPLPSQDSTSGSLLELAGGCRWR